MPGLLAHAGGYRSYDPALTEGGPFSVEEGGDVQHRDSGVHGFVALAVALAAGVGAVLLLGHTWWTDLLWGVGAATVAFVVVAVLLPTDPQVAYRKAKGREAFVTTDDDPRATRICRLAAELAETEAYRNGQIDTDRILPRTVWSAVNRSRWIIESGCAADDELRAAVAELEQVEATLRELGVVARQLDHLPPPGAVGPDASQEVLAHAKALRDLL